MIRRLIVVTMPGGRTVPVAVTILSPVPAGEVRRAARAAALRGLARVTVG